jgi:hypothetical protein
VTLSEYCRWETDFPTAKSNAALRLALVVSPRKIDLPQASVTDYSGFTIRKSKLPQDNYFL